MKSIFRFWNELKRRNVPKGIISYIVFSWVILQVISVLGSLIDVPAWLGKTVLISLLIFLPFWLFFSWFYDITSEGIKRTRPVDCKIDEERSERVGKRLNVFIISFLMIAVILLIVDRTRLSVQKKQLLTSSTTDSTNSIAVLPFKDISAQQNQAYFSDGLAEEIINALSKITNIKVTSRTSAFSFKNKTLNIPEIAKKLGVSYILEGSVRTYDSIVRVSVQLIDAKNDNYAWSQSWDKQLKNIFQIQNEISSNIVSNLSVKITGNTFKEAIKVDPEAYKLYLKARYEYLKRDTQDGAEIAEEFLKKSLEIDSTYAPSWELLSRVYHHQNNTGYLSVKKGYPLALNAAKKAIELDSTLATVYDIMGTIAIDYKKDFKKAQELVDKGLSIEPNNINVLDRAAEVALINDQLDKAVAYYNKIVETNPLDPYSFISLGLGNYWLKNYDVALKALKKAQELDPKNDVNYYLLGCIYLQQGKLNKALEMVKAENDPPYRLQLEAMIYHALGKNKKAAESLKALIDGYEKNYSFQIACVYAYYKDKDQMFYWLDKGIEYQDFGLIETKPDPLFDFARNDPRWTVFTRKIGFTE